MPGSDHPLLRITPALVLAAAVPTCFDGADALGLPCELDRDCGLDQKCIQGVCAAKGDDAPPETCGDGIVQSGAGEECDDGNDDDTDDCTNACTVAVCGDGIVQPGRGEECDDGNTQDDGTCMADCSRVWFFDDGEDPAAFDTWTVQTFGGDPNTTWTRVASNGLQSTAGYHLPPQPTSSVVRGGVRLVSPPITLSEVGGGGVELRFMHKFDFNPCSVEDLGDGGILEVSDDDGATWATLTPTVPLGYPKQLDTPSGCQDGNPLGSGTSAFAGDSNWTQIRADLSPYAGKTVRLAFTAGFDCETCSAMLAGPALVWILDEIVVARPSG